MKIDWTDEQLKAIKTRNCNLLVAAAAGAGKTAVLVERIIRRITGEDAIDIDRLLVVTFTNAAASEMKERIGRALIELMEENPGNIIIQRQAALLDRAQITTIHSFCMQVVRSNFHILGIDPEFRIGDDGETSMLKQEVLEELFENYYRDSSAGDAFYMLADGYGGGKSDIGLQDLVREIFEFVRSSPSPAKWLREKADMFKLGAENEIMNTLWVKTIMSSAVTELEGLLSGAKSSRQTSEQAEGLESYIESLEKDIRNIEKLLGVLRGNCSWDELQQAFAAFSPEKLNRCGKNADEDAKAFVQNNRDRMKKNISKIRDEIFNVPLDVITKDFNKIFPLLDCLVNLVQDFDTEYADKKKQKGMLDYSDLEHMCLSILRQDGQRTAAAEALSDRYEEILIDEYQDSNLIQEVILNSVSRNERGQNNIFMVGDIKQSIYRFRQAKPELFLRKYNDYPDVEGQGNFLVRLFNNYRSRNGIIDAVNYIFGQIMSVSAGELDYTEAEALKPGAVFPPMEQRELNFPEVQLCLVDMAGTDNREDEPENEAAENGDTDAQEPLDAVRCEARLVASKIQSMIGENGIKVYDKEMKAYRMADYRDVVVILRALKGRAEIFAEEFSAKSIPVYTDSDSGYFQTLEVRTVLSLLQIVDNPLQDIPLLAVLRSPVGMFTSNELADIRLCEKAAPFYDAMVKFADVDKTTRGKKVGEFLLRLESWRDKALYTPVDEFLWQLFDDTAYFNFAGTLPGGRQRQANLRILLEYAGQYEKTSFKGLFNFINFVEKLKKSGSDMDTAKLLGENDNVVRIMSIHKSKGLEFPVVFVSGCGKRFNNIDMNKIILRHQDLGFGPDLVDVERRITYPLMPKQAIRYKLKMEMLAEEIRLLYVALTRAKERLIITGAAKDLQNKFIHWSASASGYGGKLTAFEVSNANMYLDWLVPVLILHPDGAMLRENLAAYMKTKLEQNLAYDKSKWVVEIYKPYDFVDGPVRDREKSDNDKSNDDIGNYEDAVIERNSGTDTETETDTAADTGTETGTETGKYKQEDGDSCIAVDDRIEAAVRDKLEWIYPFSQSTFLPSKITVSELKRRFEFQENMSPDGRSTMEIRSVDKPEFMKGKKKFSAAEKGTLTHFVMQHLDLDGVVKAITHDVSVKAEIIRQIAEMVKVSTITSEEAAAVHIQGIATFFSSDLGGRMLKSASVRREIPFTLGVEARDLFPDLGKTEAGSEIILLQGVIDCFFEENGAFVLVDYKTDYVQSGKGTEVAEKYRVQVKYYEKALEQINGVVHSNSYIYLLHSNEIIKM